MFDFKDVIHIALALGWRKRSEENDKMAFQRARQFIQVAQAALVWYPDCAKFADGAGVSYDGYTALARAYGWQHKKGSDRMDFLHNTQKEMISLLQRLKTECVPEPVGAVLRRSDLGYY